MTKASRILQTISFILVGVLVCLLIINMLVSIRDTRQATRKLDSIEARVINLEQDLKNTKEVLDAHGFEDLNL